MPKMLSINQLNCEILWWAISPEQMDERWFFFAGKNLRKEEIDTSLLDGCVHAYPVVKILDTLL